MTPSSSSASPPPVGMIVVTLLAGALESQVLLLEDVALGQEEVPFGNDDRVTGLGQDDGRSEPRSPRSPVTSTSAAAAGAVSARNARSDQGEPSHESPPVIALSSPVSIGGPPRISSLPDASMAVGRRRKRPMKIARRTLTM